MTYVNITNSLVNKCNVLLIRCETPHPIILNFKLNYKQLNTIVSQFSAFSEDFPTIQATNLVFVDDDYYYFVNSIATLDVVDD